jgi:hypothetical protein
MPDARDTCGGSRPHARLAADYLPLSDGRHPPRSDSEAVVSAEIISLSERRAVLRDPLVVDVITAIDVAIRDLCEIEVLCGSKEARRRAAECRQMLVAALSQA